MSDINQIKAQHLRAEDAAMVAQLSERYVQASEFIVHLVKKNRLDQRCGAMARMKLEEALMWTERGLAREDGGRGQ